MKFLDTSKRTLLIASTLLYRYGGNNILVQTVEYDYFHLLVTLDKNTPAVRCGVVVIEIGHEMTISFKNFIDTLRHKQLFEKSSPDNMPILLIRINTEKEIGDVSFLVGINNQFEQTIYTSPNPFSQLNTDAWLNVENVVRSMTQTITVLSLSSVCLLRQYNFQCIDKRRKWFHGVILYARKNAINYQIKAIKEEDTPLKYLFDPKFEKDELDKLIHNSIIDNFRNIVDVTSIQEKLIITSEDIKDLRLYAKQYGYENIPFTIRLFPKIADINQALEYFGLDKEFMTPNISDIMIYIQGNSDLIKSNTFYQYQIPINQWFMKCNEIMSLQDSLVPINKWINFAE